MKAWKLAANEHVHTYLWMNILKGGPNSGSPKSMKDISELANQWAPMWKPQNKETYVFSISKNQHENC